MTEDALSKLFTPFFTTKIYGTGLGLSICQRIIEAHCGSIVVRSVVNEGTEVILRLPLTHDFCPDNNDGTHDCAPCC
ncbi:MAG: HAMP domain-containing sensor histidine kinase [Thermodesulfobacteriota bacterium]|nr:HAMP domain-containing sensor histidine kinase [Thermodesulfobacteriota bacterium]